MTRENQDRYAVAARIRALLEPEMAAEGWQLVDVRVFPGGGRLQVRLYVDLPGDERIDLDGCARASRSAGMFLEEADIFAGAWVLEVSSPGLERKLRKPAHYVKSIGREVKIKARVDGTTTTACGELTSADVGRNGRLAHLTVEQHNSASTHSTARDI